MALWRQACSGIGGFAGIVGAASSSRLAPPFCAGLLVGTEGSEQARPWARSLTVLTSRVIVLHQMPSYQISPPPQMP